jgi:heme exporter protein A
MTDRTMLLRLSAVAHVYGTRLIFRGVSCTLEAGEILLVAGPNGAGKSTLLKIMAGLITPETGRVERFVPDRGMAFMGHRTFVYPDLTALGNLDFWNSIYDSGQDTEALVALLARVGLKNFALERAGTFSRGMAQRLSLARTLLVTPTLILLDEPSTGLDSASQDLLRRELHAAKARGAGIVWISHDLERDLQHADTVLHLAERGPAYYGPATEFPQGGAA